MNSTSPSVLFGGTWERITGKFLLAATDSGNSGASQAAGNTGGAATVTLTAAQSGLSSHSHSYNAPTNHQHTLSTAGGALFNISNLGDGYIRVHFSEDGPTVANTKYTQHPSWASAWNSQSGSRPTATTSLVGKTDSGGSSSSTNTGSNTATSATESHNNMPPYLSVYVWKRTA